MCQVNLEVQKLHELKNNKLTILVGCAQSVGEGIGPRGAGINGKPFILGGNWATNGIDNVEGYKKLNLLEMYCAAVGYNLKGFSFRDIGITKENSIFSQKEKSLIWSIIESRFYKKRGIGLRWLYL